MDSKFMDFKEGDMIEHSMISRAIENAQKKVEKRLEDLLQLYN